MQDQKGGIVVGITMEIAKFSAVPSDFPRIRRLVTMLFEHAESVGWRTPVISIVARDSGDAFPTGSVIEAEYWATGRRGKLQQMTIDVRETRGPEQPPGSAREVFVQLDARRDGRVEVLAPDVEARGLSSRIEELMSADHHVRGWRPLLSDQAVSLITATVAGILTALIMVWLGLN